VLVGEAVSNGDCEIVSFAEAVFAGDLMTESVAPEAVLVRENGTLKGEMRVVWS
jgi:hypothetical protein